MEQLVITQNVKFCTLIIYAIMFFLTLGAHIIGFIKKNADLSNFKQRMKSFWMIVILFTIAFAWNKITALIFLAFISYLALKEYLSLITTRRTDRRVLLWAYLSIPIQLYFIYTNWLVMFYLFVPLYMFLLIPVRMVTIGENEGFLKACGTIHWGIMTTVYALGYLMMYLALPADKNPVGGGVGLLLFVLFITVFNDFAQYIWGKSLGRHKIIPKVSPNKTWEGFVGGVITTSVISAMLAPYLTPLTLHQGIFAGFALSIAGFLGDVIMSAIKRDLGVKDTGTLLPGHGGILDRLDSLIFTAPLFFHYVVYLHFQGLL